MKEYRQFFHDGIAYWQDKLRVFCWAFYLLYSSPVDSPRLARRRTRRSSRQAAVFASDQPGMKRSLTPGLRAGFALFPVPVR